MNTIIEMQTGLVTGKGRKKGAYYFLWATTF